MALAYLLCPTFQIENTAGKPATGGWLEVYVAGSRTKYYCASDFDGTLHPFRIPLDSLGSNIVLADDAGTYDVYVYNRYGGEMMSRYNVKPGSGGGIGSITSSDGSIIITPTENGLDLRMNSEAPSILRATAQNLSADGQFQFSELQRDGQDAVVDTNGRVMVNEGWWHYDATVRLRWPGDPNVNGTQSISLYTANASDSTSFDLSYAHRDTVQVNGEFKAENDGTQFVLGVTGVQPGMTVELVDYGIHSIIGEGAGGRYNAGDGITIDEPNRVISVDFDEVQEKLTPGTGIEIDENNVISTTAQPQVQADWAQSDSTAVDYIKNKPAIPTKTSDLANDSGFITGADLPTVDQTYDDTSTNAQSGTAVADAIAASLETFFAVYGVTTIGEVDTAYAHGKDIICRYNSHGHVYSSQLSSLVSGRYTFSTTDGFTDYEFTLSPNGGTGDWSIDSRAIPSGTLLVPDVTESNVGEVLTVDQNGVPEWAPAQAPIIAGNGIDITDNLISVDTSVVATQNDLAGKQDVISDLSSIRAGAALGATAVQDPNYVHTDNNYTDADKTKLAGIQAGAEANVQSDWAESDSSSDSFIRNKPGQTNLVAGANITIVDDAQNNTVTISAAATQSQVQDVTVGGVSVLNAQGVAEVPSIPVIGTITL